MYANRDEAGQRNFLNQCRKWMFSLSLVGTLALLFLGKTILSLFGPEFVAGYPVMVVLSIGLLIRALAGPLQGLLVVTGRQNVAAFALAVTVVINITLNILLIPKYGLMGAAIATSIAFGVESLLFLVANHRVARPGEGLPGNGQVA
jgi:O-antigen/teichoic acid export membrane protein